jgi:hypothetical protein
VIKIGGFLPITKWEGGVLAEGNNFRSAVVYLKYPLRLLLFLIIIKIVLDTSLMRGITYLKVLLKGYLRYYLKTT